MEYYSVMKKHEILSFATTWMGMVDFVLSEISQAQKDEHTRSNSEVKSEKVDRRAE
jgi:hypothetical protein